jgi:hypothetical protein
MFCKNDVFHYVQNYIILSKAKEILEIDITNLLLFNTNLLYLLYNGLGFLERACHNLFATPVLHIKET